MRTSKLILLPLLFLAACSTVNLTPQATGGSKSDGIVHLSYQYAQLQKPIVDWVAAEQEAISRCSAWGYSSVEPFGGANMSCVQYGGIGGGCAMTQVTKSYQCIE